MLRRFTSTALLAVVATCIIWANERATFILTDGQRKTGEITSRPPEGQNPATAAFTIMVSPGQEETILANQIAVIDFTGGNPPANELTQLPASGNYLVLRNGVSGPGTFLNLLGGDTLVWRAEQGQEQRYAVRDVSRVYLNPQSARTALNFTGATNAVGTVGTQAPPGTVFVQANQAWTDTGIDVKRGDHYMFRSTGNIAFGRGPGQTADANGKVGEQSNAFPVPVAPVGALIGKVGNSAPFSIGANTQLPGIVMPQNGRLFLGVNDNELGDNSGAFTVAITKR